MKALHEIIKAMLINTIKGWIKYRWNTIEVHKTGDDSNIKLFAGIDFLSLLEISYIIIIKVKISS